VRDLTSRGAPLEYWFFRTEVADLRLLVDLIVRRAERTVETRVACTVGDTPTVSHDVQPMTSHRAEAEGIATASARIDASRTVGDSGGVSWALDLDLGRHRIQPVSAALASAGSLDMLLLSRPAATFSGTVATAGRSWILREAPGMVAHYWGRALAPSWCWVSVVGGPGEPRIEATVLRSRLWGSPATIKGGYAWTWSGLDADTPSLFSMPSNGSWITWRREQDAVVVQARRTTRRERLSASAVPSSFVPFGDGIRNSQRASVRWAGRDLSGALEFRDAPSR
jgi:hypothetical protein